jgi:hypothetical protein
MQGIQGIPNMTPEPNQGQGVTQSLIEALAKERELKRLADAERDIALQLETNPATITDQNSQEVEAKTQAETAKGIAGVLQKRQSDMQANINRAAQGVQPQGVPAAGGQMAKFANGGIVGYSNGGPTSSRAGRTIGGAMDWVRENPGKAAEYASLGLMFIPGLGLANLGRMAAMRGIAKFAPGLAPKLGGGITGLAKKAFTKPYKAKPGQTVYRNPKTGRMESLDPTKRTAKGLGSLPRSFSPTRTAGTLGTAGYLGSKLFGGQEPEVQERNISEGKFGPGSLKGFGPAYPKEPMEPPSEKRKTGISDEFLATLRGARKGDMTGARMAYKAGQKGSELENLKFQSLDSYRQLTATQIGINNLMQQKAKLLKEMSELKQNSPLFQPLRVAQTELVKAMESGDNSKITAAQEEVTRAGQEASKRWAEANPVEAKALEDLEKALQEARARQSNVSTNWMGSSPTSSDFNVKRTN